MSGSKSKKTCKFVFKRGANKGKKCGRPCVSTYCFAHNKNNLKYKKNYNTQACKKNKEKKLTDKLEKLFNTKDLTKLPNLENLQFKVLHYRDEINRLIKLRLGHMDILKEDNMDIKKEYDKIVNILNEKLKLKFVCTGEGNEVKKWIDKEGNKFTTINACDCDNCIDFREAENKPIFFPYTDKITLLDTKYKKTTKKIKELKEKRHNTLEVISAIEKILSQKKNETIDD